MKLHLSILEKLVELQTKDPQELRHLIDDAVSDVKGVEIEGESVIFTVETLANRGDHVSALGIARELSARLLCSVKLPPIVASFDDRKPSVQVRKNTNKCLRYALLEMVCPKGMSQRNDIAAVIGSAGNDKHPIVNILNYLILEIGQPMHAFDRDKIDGEIIVDITDKTEQIVALDGKTYTVPVGTIVIRDKKKIVAVAGVIGCQNSMVTPETTRVLIESATFDPVTVRISARAMGLSTEASFAFERGTDIDGVLFALKRLAHLVGGAGGAVKDANGAQILGLQYIEGEPVEKRKILLDIEQIRREMNLPRLPEVEITTRLKNLGFILEATGEELKYKATVPSWRLWDVRNPEDLVEEFARAHGYNKVKLELPPLDYDVPELEPIESLTLKIEPALHGNGFREVITKGFYSADDVKILEELDKGVEEKHVRIKNAVESNYSHMKVTNILHLVKLCEENRRYGVNSSKVYEISRLFTREAFKDGRYEFENDTLSMAVAGRWNDRLWRKPEAVEDISMLFKGVIESVLTSIGVRGSYGQSKHKFLHPGHQGVVKVGRTEVGVLGLVHPVILEKTKCECPVLYAEFDMSKLCKVMNDMQYAQPSDYPSVWRDITLKLGKRDLAGEVAKFINESDLLNLAQIDVVDNFQKQGEDFRRVTYRLVFQSRERTLASTEVDSEMTKVLSNLKVQRGLELAG